MSFAHYDSSEDRAAEARNRINSARVRDLSFLIRRSTKQTLSEKQVDTLARVLARLEAEHHGSVSRTAIEDALRVDGVPNLEVDYLVKAVFNRD